MEEPPAWLGALLQPLLEGQRQQLADILRGAQGGAQTAAMTGAAAAVVGPMAACSLGKDKIKRYKKWRDWIGDAENKMKFIGTTSDIQKISFLQSCGGAELTELWEKEVRIRFEPGEEVNGLREEAHTYAQLLEETKKALLKVVSRDRAIINLFQMEQGSKSFMDYLSEVEDQTNLCTTWEPLTGDDLKRISLLAGIKDRTLAEKALAEEYSLKQVIQMAINRESLRANAEALRTRPTLAVHRVDNSEELQDGNLDAMINHQQARLEELQVRKLRQSGKYSGRWKGEEETKERCPRCTYEKHQEGNKCPAEGRECRECGKEGHFAKSKICAGKKKKTTRRVKKEESSSSSSTEEEDGEERGKVYKVEKVRQWPGTEGGARRRTVRHVRSQGKEGRRRASRMVNVTVGGKEMELYCDTGSTLTIIPPGDYEPSMGKVVAAKNRLRAWGAREYLDVKGMVKTTIATRSGVAKRTWVYIVAGDRPEPLLGDHDAEDLGIISFHPEGRMEDKQEQGQGGPEGHHVQRCPSTTGQCTRLDSSSSAPKCHPKPHSHTQETVRSLSIPAKLRRAGKEVVTEKPPLRTVSAKGKTEAGKIVDKYTGRSSLTPSGR